MLAAILALLLQETPNVVVILADDFGYECVGANGGTSYPTPHLDRLAAGGARFTQAYAQPLCTPTRVQLLTGLSNVRNYARFGEMDPKSVTFANHLKKRGYATAVAGKWQLGRDVDLPRRFGFDESCLWQHTRRPPRYANPGLEIDGVEKDFTNGEYGPDLVHAWALDFVSRRRESPFLLFYSMTLTHDPFQPTPDSAGWDPKARGEKASDPRHFADMVKYMDKQIGSLVAKLEELRLREKTLILFAGDNGTSGHITSELEGRAYKGAKGSPTRAGMRVPLILNRPGAIPAGQVRDELADSTDLFATILRAAGAPLPEPCDGRDLLSGGPPRDWIYCWYSQDGKKVIAEFAFDARHKLTRAGKLFEDERPLPEGALPEVRARLQAGLDTFKGFR